MARERGLTVRQARRQRRHPRQRRRARDVHARRRRARPAARPANFLDAGGGSRAEAITQAVEVILSNPNVTAVLFNIFGGITRCDEVGQGPDRGVQPDQAEPCRSSSARTAPTTSRAASCSPTQPAQRAHESTMLGAAKRVVMLRRMSILVDNDTKLCVSGITGREGTFHAMNNRRYGTNVVAGVTPARAARTSRASGLQHVPLTRSRRPARTRR
jgi:hypothetical protein